MFIENKKPKVNFEKGFYKLTRDVASTEGTITKGSIVYAWKNEDCPTKLWFEEKGGNNILIDFEEVKDALCKTDDIIRLEEKMYLPEKIREGTGTKYKPSDAKKCFLREMDEGARRRDLERLIAENDDSNGTLKSLEKAYGIDVFLTKSGFTGAIGFFISLMVTYFMRPNIEGLVFVIVFFTILVLSMILDHKYGLKIYKLKKTWEKNIEKQIYALEDNTTAVTDTVRPNSDILMPKEPVSFDTVEENYGGLVLNRTAK